MKKKWYSQKDWIPGVTEKQSDRKYLKWRILQITMLSLTDNKINVYRMIKKVGKTKEKVKNTERIYSFCFVLGSFLNS